MKRIILGFTLALGLCTLPFSLYAQKKPTRGERQQLEKMQQFDNTFAGTYDMAKAATAKDYTENDLMLLRWDKGVYLWDRVNRTLVPVEDETLLSEWGYRFRNKELEAFDRVRLLHTLLYTCSTPDEDVMIQNLSKVLSWMDEKNKDKVTEITKATYLPYVQGGFDKVVMKIEDMQADFPFYPMVVKTRFTQFFVKEDKVLYMRTLQSNSRITETSRTRQNLHGMTVEDYSVEQISDHFFQEKVKVVEDIDKKKEE